MKQQELTSGQISAFCLELSLLMHAGVAVGDALALVAEERKDQPWLQEAARQADCGSPLTQIIRDSGRFPAYVPGLLAVGDQTGRTEEALEALSRYYDGRERLEHQVRSALLYPAMLLLLMLVVIVVLLAKVLPVFDRVYASLGGQLTGVAAGLLTIGRILDSLLPLLCVLLAAVVVFAAVFAAGGPLQKRVLHWWQKRRGDRGVSRKLNTARLAQALAMALRSGLPLEEALTLAGDLLGAQAPEAQRCRNCRERLERGEELSAALKETGVLPAAECRLVALGERGGSGDAVMDEVARRLTEEGEHALTELLGRVEPTLVLGTALLVGMILLSVMLPLMNIMAAIG